MGRFASESEKHTKWEFIEDSEYRDTARLSVPGGWVVRERLWTLAGGYSYKNCGVSILFVADGDHEWII